MEICRKSGVAGVFTVPLIDVSKRPSYKLNPIIVAGDVKVIRHTGGAWNVSNIDATPGVIPGSTSNVLVELTDVELTTDDLKYPIIVQFIDQTAIKEWDDQTVIIWTQEIASDLAKIDGDPVTDNSATLALKTLTIINPNGHGIDITPGTTYHGIHLFGGEEGIHAEGTNHGIKATSAGAPLSGAGFLAEGGGGPGIQAIGAEESYDIDAKELKGLLTLDSPIDSVPISDVLELVLAMVNGRFVKDPEAGTITFYKRDNSTVLFTVGVSETERARL